MTGTEFRARRDALGLTRAELAAAMGIAGARPSAGIEDWESGRREIPAPVATLMRAFEAFGLPETWPLPKKSPKKAAST